jgi:predicted DNA-binding transcriptional regulator AlpA
MSDENGTATDKPLLITAQQVGTILGVSERSVWRHLSKGKIVAPVRIGGSVRWRREDITRWVAEGCPVPERPRQPR